MNIEYYHVHVSVSMTVANRNCCNRKRLGTLQQQTVTVTTENSYWERQLETFNLSDMRGKVLGHEQEDVLELCLMLLADGSCSMPGAVVAIRVTEKVKQLVVSLKTSYVNEEWNRQQQSSCLQIISDVSLHGCD